MENNVNNSGANQTVYNVRTYRKTKSVFTKSQKIISVICIVLGFLFIKVIANFPLGVGASVFFALLFTVAFIFMVKCGSITEQVTEPDESSYLTTFDNTFKLSPSCVFGYICFMVLSFSFTIAPDNALKTLVAVIMIVGGLYWVYTCSQGKSPYRKNTLTDIFESLLDVPFSSFLACPRAFSQCFSKGKKHGGFIYVVIGLLIALPLTLLLALLLSSGDEMFSRIFSYGEFIQSFFISLFQLLLGLPVACYIFGSLYGSAKTRKNSANAQPTAFKSASKGYINQIIIYSVMIPVFLLYCVFFFSQLAYFIGAFQSYLPEGFTYAEYARRGFFELCTVVAINLLITFLAISLCCKDDRGRVPVGVRVFAVILSVFTLMFIAVSVSKMVMYISFWGFTHLRIYTLWLMAFFAVVVFALIIKQLVQKLPYAKTIFAAFMVMLTLFSFSNTDAVIAKYNVQWYQQGKIEWMGADVLSTLDDSAVPYLVELADNSGHTKTSDKDYYYPQFEDIFSDSESYFDSYDDSLYPSESELSPTKQVNNYLYYKKQSLQERSVLSFNLPANRAWEIVKDFK